MKPDDLPFVTVIMPVYNEAAFIQKSLGAALAQDYPPERMEVLVVDGGSADQTRNIVEDIRRSDPRVRLLDNPDRVQAAAMNIGIKAARGEIIARLDGHSEFPADYLSTCVRVLETSGADNVGGHMRATGNSPFGAAVALAINARFGTGGARFHLLGEAGDVDTVSLGVFKRSIFDRAGGYDQALTANEDYELNYRIRQSGGRVYYSPEIWAGYTVRQSLGSLMRQFYRYGQGKGEVAWLHPPSLLLRHLVAPLFVAALALFLIVGLAFPAAWLLGGGLIALYGSATLIASILISARQGWGNLRHLLVIFPAMHLTWAAGFWVGVARYRWRRHQKLRVN